ncbi:MAG: hypothetical protein CME10_08410 [Gemmatimonadetes bacterium]|nr:hypothetical protein [Gemmatimonadota bacterium]
MELYHRCAETVSKFIKRPLVFVLGLTFLIRILVLYLLDYQTFSKDEAHWLKMGINFYEEGLLSESAGTFRPPLYPLLIALCYNVFDGSEVFLRLIQIVLSTVTCWFLYEIAKSLKGVTAGIIAASIFSLYPLCVFFSVVLLAETLLLFCTGLIYWCLHRYCISPNCIRATWIGVGVALGVLCKPVMLVWLPGLLAVVYHRCVKMDRFIHTAVILITLCAAILPWTLRNVSLTGHVVPISTNTGINLLIGNEPGSTGYYRDGIDYWAMANKIADFKDDPIVRDTKIIRAVVEDIWIEPLWFVRMGIVKVLILWNPLIEDGSWLERLVILITSGPLLFVGMLGVWKFRNFSPIWSTIVFILGLTIVHAIFFSHVRFRLPIDLVLIVPAACYLAPFCKGYLRRDDS